ncbi:MAG: CPBP family intramembrane metalloprotease [Lutibacter sp.]|uniref:CPBP family intramembrane glutamic endopeptidase n=1 Tax=Lutibacter sp. TaxID=1925666 RepID=UPI0017B7BB25|nr:CPBP family intramembrane glutamic endopeptidase [Lutibacter sp.]MBT8316307.1 CPBP family intramembrane metalloprotease [Lutibacter sp.]NNJ57167.1 CPBP family intramembrane metalloprotease [Lutibacter sp.]
MKFIQQAYKGENEWWAYLVTIFILFFGWQFLGVIPLVGTAFFYAKDTSEFITSANDNFTTLGIDSNLYLLLVIFTFLAGLLSLFFGIKQIHKRKIITLITSRDRVDWNRVFFAFLIWAVIGVLMITAGYFMSPEDFIWNFKPLPFFLLVIISFLFLPIQTSMEEILFRGYLMQGFGTWFKKTFVALLLTSVIFGLLHGLNPEVEKLGWITMVYYIGTGLVLGIFTLMDEGTELALGFHAANNIIAAVLVTANWTVFQTDALLIDTSEPSVGWEMFVPVFILYPLVLFIFSKKYGWSNWKEKLFGHIYKPIELNEDEFIAN